MEKRQVRQCLACAMLLCMLSPADARGPYTLTPTVKAIPPENTEGGSPAPRAERWYVNPKQTIWMYGELPWVADRPLKIAWFRPAGAELRVTGQRLDASAAPLGVEIGSGREYKHRFLPSQLRFPAPGIWEIKARSGDHQFRVLVEVAAGK